MALNFMNILAQMEDMGVFNIILPFLLVFAITFAILEKVKIFGDKRQINGIIAAILGILVARNQYVVGIINRFLPNISLFMVVILMFLLLFGIFSGEYKGFKGSLLGLAMIFSIIFVVWSLTADFVGERFELPNWLYGFSDDTQAAVLLIAIFVIVIWYVTKGPPTADEKPPFGKWLASLGGESTKP